MAKLPDKMATDKILDGCEQSNYQFNVEHTGSVGVKQAEIHSAEATLSPGKSQSINAAEITQPIAIVGTTMTARSFHCLARYAGGRSTPIAKTPVASVSRIISSVIAFTSVFQVRGLNMFAPNGPIMIPNAVARTDSPIYSWNRQNNRRNEVEARHTRSLTSKDTVLKKTMKPPTQA
jgi:hypothetical protein